MTRLAFVAALVALTACATQGGHFGMQRYEHARYPYAVYYGGKDAHTLLSEHWRLANYYRRSRGRLAAKNSPAFLVERFYDYQGDGRADLQRREPFFDLLLEHRRKDASLWVRSVPLSRTDKDKELEAMAERYLDAVSSGGSVLVPFGSEAQLGPARRFATRVLERRACTVSGAPALRVDFEVGTDAGALRCDGARWVRGRVVIVRTGYTTDFRALGHGTLRFPTLMLVGLSATTQDFAALAPDFDRLLGHIALGSSHLSIPSAGGQSCGSLPSSGGAAALSETFSALGAHALRSPDTQ